MSEPAASWPMTWRVTVIGRLMSPTGVPIVGAGLTSDSGTRTVTPESGQFALGCEAGAEITVQTHGYPGIRVEVPAVAQGIHDLGDIVLKSRGVVTVEVVCERGGPVAAVPVAWTETRKAEGILNRLRNPCVEENRWIHAGQTDREGLLSLAGLPVGRGVLVRVLKDGAPVVDGPVRPRTAEDPAFVRIVVPSVHVLSVRAAYADGVAVTDPVEVRRLDGRLAGRWQREYPNSTGRTQIPLVEGAYEIDVLVERYERYSSRIHLTADTTVDFKLDRRLQVELAVADPNGDPVAGFFVAVTPARPCPFEEHELFTNAQPGEQGMTTLRLPYDREERDSYHREIAVLVRAPGFSIARSIMAWPESDGVLQHHIRLEEGVVIHGSTRHLPEGAAVACHILATEGVAERPARWRGEDAPRVDLSSSDAGGSWTLRGLGPGVYDVRALVGHSAIGLGRVEAPASGHYDLQTDYAPARVEVYLDAPLGAGPMPVLFPLQDHGKWAARSGERWGLGPSAVGGTVRGGSVVFEPLAAGPYVLHDEHVQSHRDWASSSSGVRLELEPGETKTVHLGPPVPWEQASFLVSVPPSLSRETLVYTAVPCAYAFKFAGNLAWKDVTPQARHTIAAPGGAPFHVVVAALPHGSRAAHKLYETSVFPVFFERVASVRELDGRTLTVLEPARARVEVSGGASVELKLLHKELGDVLRDTLWVLPGDPIPPLVPGPYRLVAEEAVRGRARRTVERDIVLVSAPPVTTIDIAFE